MIVTLPPIEPTDATAADAAPALAILTEKKLVTNDSLGGTWLKEILNMRNRGELALKPAVFLTLYILDNTPQRTVGTLWSHLAASEILGQVDTTTLTRELLNRLVQDGINLHLNVFTKNVRTLTNLANLTNARASAVVTQFPTIAPSYRAWYDRVRDALTPHLAG